MKNPNIKYHILCSGLLAAITTVFASSFQAIMKSLLFPVSLYGLVYFINHLFRALASLYADKINRLIPLSKMIVSVFVLFVLCFLLTFVILNVSSVPVSICLCYFIFISFVIGGQLAFRILHDCRLHTFIPSDMRATSSSVSTAVGRLHAGFFFILMKILLDGIALQNSLAVCFIIFLMASYPIKKVYTTSLSEEKTETP
jgi:hypothetical protein